MRSILISAGVLAALVAAFVVFLVVQKPSAPQVTARPRPSTTLPTIRDNTGGGLGGGEGGWVQRFNPKTGELVNELRAKTYDPPIDNVIHVIEPQARFYGSDGNMLTLTANTGDITLAQSAKKADGIDALQAQPPSRGKLYDVTLELFERDDDPAPVLTATLPVIEFDNDTLRLNTPSTSLDGNPVVADRVPVTVRGRDYDFDGEGLIVRYNQRDNRLERLEIAHGKRLVIKNPDAIGKQGARSDAGPLTIDGRPIEFADAAPETARRMSAEERERRLQRRAATSRRAAASQAATRSASTKPRELFAYVATFHEDVKLSESGEPVGAADTMAITFASKTDDSPSSRPVVAPTPEIVPPTQPAHHAATRPAVTQPAVVQPAASQPAAARATPATRPSGPVEITWTGKLVVVPKKLAESGLRSTRDRIIEFAGRPTTLMRQGSRITAATIRAATEGDRLRAGPDATTPVVTLSDPTGTTLTTESIEADGDNANLYGKSRAEIVLDKIDGQTANAAQATTQPATLVTTWDKFATLRLTTRAGNKRGIERAVFRGNVDVQHPQLKMTSDTLALGFTQPANAKQPQISTVRADGSVKASVASKDGTPQTITAETLDLATASDADNKLTVHSMHASGNVVASDAKQTLKTDDLTVMPSASDAGGNGAPVSLAVDQMTAKGHVHFSTADGSAADADRLSVDRVDGGQWVTLVGTPAKVIDPRMNVTGNYIRVNPDSGGHAIIDGAGALHAVQAGEAGKPGQPIDVSWTKSMDYNAAANKAGVNGDVTIVTRSADGTASTAKGATLDLVLTDAPADNPNTKPAARPAGLALNGGANKIVKSFTLLGPAGGNVEVSSELRDPKDANKIIRLAYLEAASATVDMNPDGTPGGMTVPVGGRILYENNGQPAAAPAPNNPAGANGTVAMAWKKSMTYDAAKQQLVIDGDVNVVRQNPGQPAVTLSAPRVVADVTGNVAPGGAQLKKVTAEQAVLSTPQVTLNAATAVYDPAADRVIAKGTPREPVKWFDQTGQSKGSFGEIWWNLKTGQPDKVIDVKVEMNR